MLAPESALPSNDDLILHDDLWVQSVKSTARLAGCAAATERRFYIFLIFLIFFSPFMSEVYILLKFSLGVEAERRLYGLFLRGLSKRASRLICCVWQGRTRPEF